MIGRTNTGGGSGLNFQVVGGTTAPRNPKENMIWVDTDVKITSWIFSANEPENPKPGMVWISTGSSSIVAFNALKKNGIYVYPISAKQYIAGGSTSILGEALLGEMVLGSTTSTDPQWVNKTAKSYHEGKWVDWIVYLYNSGDSCVDLTGGYTAVAMSWSSSTPKKNAPTVTNNDDHMLISQIAGAGGAVYTEKKIDLSGFKTLYFDGMISCNTSNLERANLSIWSDIGTYKETNRVAMMKADNLEGIKLLDISSLTGEYHIGFYLYNSGGDTTSVVKLNKMWLE